VRITLADKIDPEIACRLAEQMELPFISLTESPNPAIALLSDDDDIELIIGQIMKNSTQSGVASGFFLNYYPQNVTQARSLDMALAAIGHPISTALMMESAKMSQNREKRALIRYYRSQNKLILIEESSSSEDICNKIHSIHMKRRKNSG
jgi:adenylate kinase family enzyme